MGESMKAVDLVKRKIAKVDMVLRCTNAQSAYLQDDHLYIVSKVDVDSLLLKNVLTGRENLRAHDSSFKLQGHAGRRELLLCEKSK